MSFPAYKNNQQSGFGKHICTVIDLNGKNT